MLKVKLCLWPVASPKYHSQLTTLQTFIRVTILHKLCLLDMVDGNMIFETFHVYAQSSMYVPLNLTLASPDDGSLIVSLIPVFYHSYEVEGLPNISAIPTFSAW